VAKVETQLSFVNQLVSFLTLGIYTPMQITVTCAAASKTAEIPPPNPDKTVARGADSTAVQAVFAEAAAEAVAARRTVYVQF